MFLLHDEWPNWEIFDKDGDLFEILIDSKTNLKMTSKNRDQIDGSVYQNRCIIYYTESFLNIHKKMENKFIKEWC